MNTTHRRFAASMALALSMLWGLSAIAGEPDNWKLAPRRLDAGSGTQQPPSNILVDLKLGLNALWVGSGDGVGRYTTSITTSDPASGVWLTAGREEGIGGCD